MGNPRHGCSSIAAVSLLFTVMCVTACGCANDQKKKADLQAGFKALDHKQYDEAIARADAFIKANPRGPGSAEALYLRGRGFEHRLAANPHDARANLQSARNAYAEALGLAPPRPLEAYIRASLGNVLYFQDDYVAAIEQWSQSYDRLDKDEIKAWVLYRIGLCQQRLGRFVDADRTFTAVGQQHANTVPAQRAPERLGARAFYVQLATLSTAANADRAIGELRKQGFAPDRIVDNKGRQVVRVGPYASYDQARQARGKLVAQYADALVVP